MEEKNNKVELNIKDAYWSYMLDSNSMDPLLDEGTTIITIKPQNYNEISVGDIIVFKSNFSEYNIVHRIVAIANDKEGNYFVTKGDNNPSEDPIKVRFEQIVAVVVGILY